MLIWMIIFGTVIGSFLNVCIFRIPAGQSLSFPPSSCGKCSTKIKAYDLIPIVSYIFLKGKCRHCGEKISIRYPLVEFLTGCLFGLIYLRYDLSFETIKYIIMVAFLIVIAFIDYDTTDVYSIVTYSGIGIGIILNVYLHFFLKTSLINYFLGLLIGSLIIGAVVFITRAMGEGDIEIAALCGIFLGWKLVLLTIFFSLIIGSIVAITLLIRKKKTGKDSMAFGPYIAMGAIISCLYGNALIDLYLRVTIGI